MLLFRPSSAEPEMELFKMAASIPGRNRAIFMLTYEELLQRRLGRYQHLTSLRPRQLVSRLTVDVTIVHHSPITQLEVLPLRTGRRASGRRTPSPPPPLSPEPITALASPGGPQLPVTTVIKKEKNVCRITFSPNIVQQARIATDGVLGDFIVRYDVQRDMGIGDIQVSLGGKLSAFSSPHFRLLSSVPGFKWTLCPLLCPQRPAGGPQERGVRHRHQRLHAGQEDPPGKSPRARLLA